MMLFIREAHMGDRIYTGLLRRSFTLYIRDGSGFHGKELAKIRNGRLGAGNLGLIIHEQQNTTDSNR